MGIVRATNIAIGALTLLLSLVATVRRYGVEGAVSPSIVLTAAIFSFTAITLTMSLRAGAPSGTTSNAGQGNAGVIWLLLLLLTAAATWELIPAADRPAIGVILALVVGLAIGAAVGPGIDLGSDGSSGQVVGSSVLSETARRRRRREGR
ncbi:hypothetical protein [Knoellia aerolata]|uniref:Uncharacterized protein n=1 Tax=Knoellia aerolata DSM 18566 TaxID=1385519 RepID=A0A0A0K3J7_9MICO|nr:hypothetical protein [Knoellia aerolata]KGN42877.1 hypothetical protein N801_11190 [Knoellia aerolata DSM 18566]